MFSQKTIVGSKAGLFKTPLKASSHASSTSAGPRKISERTRHAYAQERTAQKKHLNDERISLKELLSCGSIDDDTQARFMKVLELSYETKRAETREKYGFVGTPSASNSDIKP